MAKGTVNKVIIIGRLGMKPELRYMPSGIAVSTVSIATNDGYKDKQTGQFIENTEWHRVVIFGQQAENLAQYTQKGSLVFVEGRIRTNKWQDQTGQDRYTTEIVASTVQFVDNRNTVGESIPMNAPIPPEIYNKEILPATTDKKSPANNTPNLAELNDFDDEIPF